LQALAPTPQAAGSDPNWHAPTLSQHPLQLVVSHFGLGVPQEANWENTVNPMAKASVNLKVFLMRAGVIRSAPKCKFPASTQAMGPNLIAFAIPLFMLGIGIEWLVEKRRGKNALRLGAVLSDMGCGIAQQLIHFVAATSVFGLAYEFAHAHRFFTVPSGITSWLAAIVGVEFAYYWWHRLSHEVNILWAAHIVHHHSEDYNLAVALRQSVSTWVTSMAFYLPLGFLGVPVLEFSVVLGLSTLYQFWIHTEAIGPFPNFDRFFNSPSLHRVHHAINPEYLDKNHGGISIVFDRMFGTYKKETTQCVYGTTKPLASFNPVWAQASYYVELFQLSFRAPNIIESISVFFVGPGYQFAWNQTDSSYDIARPKYEVTASKSLSRYVTLNFIALLVSVFPFLLFGSKLPLWLQLLTALTLVFTTAVLPMLLEKPEKWRRLEIVRQCSALVCVMTCLHHAFGF
jgi:alkylglycerol monooxygenase